MNKKSFLVWRILPLVLIISILGITLHLGIVLAVSGKDTSSQKANSTIEKDIRDLTSQFFNPNSTHQDSLNADIKIPVKQRKELMLTLMKQDTKTFLNLAFPQKVSKNFNPEIKQFIEKEVTITGRFEEVVIDNLPKKTSKSEYYIYTTDNKKYRLYFSSNNTVNAHSQAKIQLSGFEIDGNIAVTKHENLQPANPGVYTLVAPNTKPQTNKTQVAATTIEKRIAVVLFNFPDRLETPWTASDIHKWTFTDPNSINAYYSENSFGKLSFTGDVYGWVTATTNAGATCDNYKIGASEAKNKLLSQGVNINTYDYIIYAFPNIPTCDFSGIATIGGKESWINGYYYTDNGSNSNVDTEVVIHELGHNLGMLHANGYDCYAPGNSRSSIASSEYCTSLEYGDSVDIMAHAFRGRQTSAYHKGQLNFLYPDNMAQTNGNGTYTLFPIEQNLPSNIQSLRVPVGVEPTTGKMMYYYLEYRQPHGLFDSFNSTDPAVNGITIRLAPDYFNSNPITNQIDTVPETYSFDDSPLTVGKIFEDTIHGIKLETISTSSVNAVVKLTTYTPICTRNAPTVSTESSPAWGLPGENVQYLLNIKNNDSISCGASTFTPKATALPAGWTQGTVTPVSIIPGGSANVLVYVKSSATSTFGAVQFTLNITHNVAIQKSTSIPVSYLVYSDIPPAITFVSPTNNQFIRAGAIPITVKIISKNQIINARLSDSTGKDLGAGTLISSGTYKFQPVLGIGTTKLQVVVTDAVYNYAFAQLTLNIVSASSTVIDIYAQGTAYNNIFPTMQLRLNGTILKQWTNIKAPLTRYTYVLNRAVQPTEILRIFYMNDTKTTGITGRNLRVDKLVINGKVFQTEAATTYSTGTFNATSNTCKPGYVKSEWLHCNGYLQYKLQ